MRGAAPDLQTFDVHLRLDPKRVSLWDLVVDLEETDDDGHLLGARRVRLADLDLPQHGADQVVVKLPTLGPRVVRRLRLYDLDGILVDAAERVHLLERINFTLSVAGGESMTTSIGDNSRPTLLRRLEAQDRSERQHRTLLEAGVPSRVVAAGDDGRALLTERLAAARGELLIYDAYFGRDDADWDLLRRVSVLVRVLTSVNITPQLATAPSKPRILCRRWKYSKLHPVPFHDRGYVWDGGGVSLGTSPNGLGGRVALIDGLEPAVVTRMTQFFESWWSDSRTRPIGSAVDDR